MPCLRYHYFRQIWDLAVWGSFSSNCCKLCSVLYSSLFVSVCLSVILFHARNVILSTSWHFIMSLLYPCWHCSLPVISLFDFLYSGPHSGGDLGRMYPTPPSEEQTHCSPVNHPCPELSSNVTSYGGGQTKDMSSGPMNEQFEIEIEESLCSPRPEPLMVCGQYDLLHSSFLRLPLKQKIRWNKLSLSCLSSLFSLHSDNQPGN